MPKKVDDYRLTKPAFEKTVYTPELIEEFRKCADPVTGPLYFMTNFMYVIHATKGYVKFVPYEYQYGMIDTYHTNRKSIVLCGRQLGKTTCAAGYLLWYAMFNPRATVLIAAHKEDGAIDIMKRVKNIYEGVPDHIRAGTILYNAESIKFDNGSEIITRTTTSDTGRGMSLSLVFLDEFDFVDKRIAKEFWASISPTMATGGKCIISSTPMNDEGQFFDIWTNANKIYDDFGNLNKNGLGTNGFKAFSAKWSDHPDRDEEWAANEMANIGEETFRREHENEFIRFSETLIDSVFLSRMHGREPEYTSGKVRWYGKIDPDMTYVVALDPSMGTGGNYAAIQILELPTLIQIGEWCHNKTKIEDQVKILQTILKELDDEGVTELYWSLESNSIGEAALVVIRNTGEEKFCGEMIHDPRNDLSQKNKRKGFLTTDRIKTETCARLKSLVENKKLTINSKMLISELKSFSAVGNTYRATTGATDDLVMAMITAIRMAVYITSWDEVSQKAMSTSINDEDDEDDYDSPMPLLF